MPICHFNLVYGLYKWKANEPENLPDDEEAGSDPDGRLEDISPLRWILKM